MASSEVAIANLALQKLGAERIVSLTEDSRNARTINNCYTALRDRELRAYKWNFAKKRATLAADATAPEFGFLYAFTLPSDFIRLLPPSRNQLDWRIEGHNGANSILTNDGDSLEIIYIKRVTDPALFDPLFVEMLAAKIAWHTCEEITQSNVKKDDARIDYDALRKEARRMNAFENISEETVQDPWLDARI